MHQDLSSLAKQKHDILVFAVKHAEYLSLTASEMLEYFPGISCVVDANNVLADDIATDLGSHGVRMLGIGKGHWGKGNIEERSNA